MCGITGVINTDSRPLNCVDDDVYKNMIKAMEHRGPDDEGKFLDENLWFGFSRLSIIDLEHGQQPPNLETIMRLAEALGVNLFLK